MTAQLVAISEGPSIVLNKPILLLGRHEECDVQIDSKKISRKHCCIILLKNNAIIRDLGSTNGVSINGKKVLEGSFVPGDELCIGNSKYILHWDSVILSGANSKPNC